MNLVMGSKPKLLVVEDDTDFAELLALSLRRKAFEVDVVNSAESAIQQATTHQYQYATVDLKLSGESGLLAVQQLVTLCDGIKIVVLTGYAGIKTAVDAIKLGAVHYLAKPASVDEIIAAFDDSAAAATAKVSDAPTNVGVLEWERIQQALVHNDFNISATARQLGMHRRTLQRKLQKKQLKE